MIFVSLSEILFFNIYSIENFIAGFEFDPTGEVMATIDRYGVCLISDVNTNICNYDLHLNMDIKMDMRMENEGGNFPPGIFYI